jgi:hypothetical protein
VYQALQFIPIHSAETTKVGQRRTREEHKALTSGIPQGSGSKRQKPTEGEPGYKNLKGLRSDLAKARRAANLCYFCGGGHLIGNCTATELNNDTITHNGKLVRELYPKGRWIPEKVLGPKGRH